MFIPVNHSILFLIDDISEAKYAKNIIYVSTTSVCQILQLSEKRTIAVVINEIANGATSECFMIGER